MYRGNTWSKGRHIRKSIVVGNAPLYTMKVGFEEAVLPPRVWILHLFVHSILMFVVYKTIVSSVETSAVIYYTKEIRLFDRF